MITIIWRVNKLLKAITASCVIDYASQDEIDDNLKIIMVFDGSHLG